MFLQPFNFCKVEFTYISSACKKGSFGNQEILVHYDPSSKDWKLDTLLLHLLVLLVITEKSSFLALSSRFFNVWGS